ncbi:MAG: vWA domain-containing protein [Patescibacteria group bacterium]
MTSLTHLKVNRFILLTNFGLTILFAVGLLAFSVGTSNAATSSSCELSTTCGGSLCNPNNPSEICCCCDLCEKVDLSICPVDKYPNCKNLTGQTKVYPGKAYQYTAFYEDYNGPVTKEGLVVYGNSCSDIKTALSYTGGPGSRTFEWVPPAQGNYSMYCLAWNGNDSVCKGDCVEGPPQFSCIGPASKLAICTLPEIVTGLVALDKDLCGKTNTSLSWNPSIGVESYTILIDDTSSPPTDCSSNFDQPFSGDTCYRTSETSLPISLVVGKTYKSTVTPNNACGVGTESAATIALDNTPCEKYTLSTTCDGTENGSTVSVDSGSTFNPRSTYRLVAYLAGTNSIASTANSISATAVKVTFLGWSPKLEQKHYDIELMQVSPFPEVSLRKFLDVNLEGCTACDKKAVDVVFTVDRSGSMTSTYEFNGVSKTQIEWAKDSARSLLSAFSQNPSWEVGNIRFSTMSFAGSMADTTVHNTLSSDYSTILSAIDSISYGQGGTCGECPIIKAYDLYNSPRSDGKQATKLNILLTDALFNRDLNGVRVPDAKQKGIDAADAGRSKGIAYYVAAFGNSFSAPTAKAVANDPDARYYSYRRNIGEWSEGMAEFEDAICEDIYITISSGGSSNSGQSVRGAYSSTLVFSFWDKVMALFSRIIGLFE